MNIRFPNITGVTEAEQILQIKSYLHQLVQQLNWVLSTIESGSDKTETNNSAFGDISAQTFYELKSLLIKSSDTLNSYYEKINERLEQHYLKQDAFNAYVVSVNQQFEGMGGKYVSKTDFDAYKQEVAQGMTSMEGRLVLKTDFDAYKQENATAIAGLQQSIDALNQRVDALQPMN